MVTKGEMGEGGISLRGWDYHTYTTVSKLPRAYCIAQGVILNILQ